ncbi:thiamine phosphate synthase [Peribacillus sp. NPDC097675]|uniref:thiamine phosphate synthase n=1 Tax=Peribacillus sp. NPDC097675 TaxID=3390618 RepID=UPI003D088F14
MKKLPFDLSVYLVTEETLDFGDMTNKIVEAVAGGATAVQLREKKASSLTFYRKASQLKQILNDLSIPLIINDRVDVALAVGADGIHVGQDDLPLPIIKALVPEDMIIGVSVSTLEEALEAERNGADYIGVGSIFPTNTKRDATIMTEGELEKICSNVSIPSVAIGGITADNIHTLSESGISGVAVVSAIIQAKNPHDAAKFIANAVQSFTN